MPKTIIPPELISEIFLQVPDKPTLATLARVSKTHQHEAEKQLYRSLTVYSHRNPHAGGELSNKQIISVFELLAAESAPYRRSRLVRLLHMPKCETDDIQFNASRPGIAEEEKQMWDSILMAYRKSASLRISQARLALSRMSNLVALEYRRSTPDVIDFDTIYHSLASLQLSAFEEPSLEMCRFIKAQPALRNLILFSSQSCGSLFQVSSLQSTPAAPAEYFQNLTTISGESFVILGIATPARRDIRSVTWRFTRSETYIGSLLECWTIPREQLDELTLECYDQPPMDTGDTLAQVLSTFTKLRTLTLKIVSDRFTVALPFDFTSIVTGTQPFLVATTHSGDAEDPAEGWFNNHPPSLPLLTSLHLHNGGKRARRSDNHQRKRCEWWEETCPNVRKIIFEDGGLWQRKGGDGDGWQIL